MVIPVYLAEVSPAKIRGAVVTANNMMITFGYFLYQPFLSANQALIGNSSLMLFASSAAKTGA